MSGRQVAVKVQRPDVREQVTLDLFVVRQIASIGSFSPIERYARQFRSLFQLVDRAAPPFIEELDYEFEASNQTEFAELIAKCDLVSDTVQVPEVIKASREVLIQEWLPGKKLTEPGAAKDQAQQVVKVLLNSYMVQLLETGILDYGLMTRISEDKRVALIQYLMHVQANMYDECLQDLEAREVIVPRLAETLNILFDQSDLRVQREKFIKQREELEASGKLEVLQSELQNIARKYGSFQLPGYATLIIRALATLEGVGLRASSSFSLKSETFPYIARRLLTDDSLRIREALKAYLYKGRSRIAPDRLDSLSQGFRTFTNLMKGDRGQAAAAGAPTPEQEQTTNADATIANDLDLATKDIAADGNFLQEILIEEGVAAVDALSRAAVLQAVRALTPLGPLAVPVAAPLRLLLGDQLEERLLTREDKQALLVIRKIVQIIQAGQPATTPTGSLEELAGWCGLGSLGPSLVPGATAFARRFSQRLAQRALQRVAEDLEVRSLRPWQRAADRKEGNSGHAMRGYPYARAHGQPVSSASARGSVSSVIRPGAGRGTLPYGENGAQRHGRQSVPLAQLRWL
eukprot:g1631.t2